MQDHRASTLELQVVMPVYNEETSIGEVVEQWCAQLDELAMRYSILAIDDGSTDGTPAVLAALHERLGARLEWIGQANIGHGPTILKGYRMAIERGAPWIFQLDSDGQCDPQYFADFWLARQEYDFIPGRRIQREDGLGRKIVSTILRGAVYLISGVHSADANVPYRLMRAEAVAPLVAKIPVACFFTNVGLSVLAARAGLRTLTIPITFRARSGGRTTVSYFKMGRHALNLYRNLREILAD